MKKTLFFGPLLALIFLSGCSHKEVYKPENVKGEWRSAGKLSAPILYTFSNGAVLKNGIVLTKDGESLVKIPQEYRALAISDGWVVAQNNENNLELISIVDTNNTLVVPLQRTVASASVQEDLIAILFGNNEKALYSLKEKKIVFKEGSDSATAVDVRVQSPYFLKDLVVFLGLDGKISIVNATTKQAVRTLLVSTSDYFNNIIYLNVIENNMVASTGSGILALSQKENREKYDIRDITYTDEGIWLTTKQGEVVSLSPNLEYRAKKKFPFAHFVGISVQNDRVFVIEQGGYMIAMTKDLLSGDIYGIDMDNDTVFTGDGQFYFSDRYVNIK
jgi:hypothetical protein